MQGAPRNMSISSSPSTSSSTDSRGIPRVGGVRCYWSLCCLSRSTEFDLIFVHPDPVLAVHLAAQRLSMMGRGLLQFIHPAERETARRDLANAIAADALEGSVTRIRFARLTQIRRLLGAKEDELEPPFDASTFVVDDEYLILDLVLNWVADGILLAFFHAVVNKDDQANNDPTKSHEEWTNYCGTTNIGEDQIQALAANVAAYQPFIPHSRFPPTRIFQIHTTINCPTRPNSLIFSWPPARPAGSTSLLDGSYNAEEYSNLMRDVDMTPKPSPSMGGQRTNCTSRFGATHSISSEGVYRQISSVWIPYGNLVFSCFQTNKQVEIPRTLMSPTFNGYVDHGYTYAQPQDWSNLDWNYVPQPAPTTSPYFDEQVLDSIFNQPTAPEAGPSKPKPKSPQAGSSRPLVRPPGDVECCRICKTSESPEWRRSESGIKDLCNACGLRLARQVAKREGRQRPRKKKGQEV